MADKNFIRSRGPPRTLLLRPPRSRSFNNGLVTEPILHCVYSSQRKLSITTNTYSTLSSAKTNTVPALVDYYQRIITENTQRSHDPPTPPNKRSDKFTTPSTIDSDQDNERSNPRTITSIIERQRSHTEETITPQPSVIKHIDSSQKPIPLFERFKAIFKEVHATEQTYVNKLQILSYELPSQIKKTCKKDENLLEKFHNTSKDLFHAFKQLYKFHSKIILAHLTALQEDLTPENINNMWLIFQEHFETIEDLYKTYYLTIDETQLKLKRLCTPGSLIERAMLQCQVHLGNIYPIDELNCPNQRLLRYPLFLENYMKRMDTNSPEYNSTHFIHDQFAAIATRCGEHLAVSSAELNKLKGRLDNKLECFDNQRLIWHGLLKKQSPRKHTDITVLYVIVFSNCILVCEVNGNKLEIKRQLSIKDTTVDVIENRPSVSTAAHSNIGQSFRDTVSYSFRVNAVEKSYQFLVDKKPDRDQWVNKIRQTVEQFESEHSPVEIRQPSHRSNDQQFGIRAPVWVRDIDVTRCQICNDRFKAKTLLSRRHHCRSCGRCICDSCSTKKLVLAYCSKEGEQRICDTCHAHFTGRNKILNSPLKITRDPNKTILFGDFRCIATNSIIWIDLQDDYHLHIYGAKLDQVEDYSVNLPDIRKMTFSEETRTFILIGKDKPYRYSLELNHQITFQKNDYIDNDLKNTKNPQLFYAKLWHESIHLARSKQPPTWYMRKHDSSDSGFSVN